MRKEYLKRHYTVLMTIEWLEKYTLPKKRSGSAKQDGCRHFYLVFEMCLLLC